MTQMNVQKARRTIPFGQPMIDDCERLAVDEVLRGNILVHGPRATQFEEAFSAYTGSHYSVSLSSCTAGLHLAYFAAGIGPGDEVIVPAMTHTATVHAVELVGATPIFVDAEIQTGNIDLDQLESAITERTRAISIVHYLGMPVDMSRLCAFAQRHRLFVVEDCALAIGTRFDGRHAGLFGDVGCFSFYPVKHMTTAEGGMLTTQSESLTQKIQYQRAFGVDRHAGQRHVPGYYDVKMLGFNYRMNEIEAAIGIEQLKKLDGFLRKRRANYSQLEQGLNDIEHIRFFKSSHGLFESSCYCFALLLDEELSVKRPDIMLKLKEYGIGTSVYYPGPVPYFTYYRDRYGFRPGQFPVAEAIASSIIALPVGPHLEPDDMEYVVATVKDVINEVKHG